MKSTTILATLAAAMAATLGATAGPAQAAVSSATTGDLTATLNLDGADDNVTISVAGGLLVHGQTTGGLNSGKDWNSDEEGDQTVPADGTFTVIVNGGAGNDAITVVANNTEIASSRLNGEAGNDVAEVNGAPTLGDAFTLDPVVGGTIKLRRTNLGTFTFDAATERFEVNGLGGNDSITANDGVGAFTLLSVDGGAGADTVNGSEGADLILGGEADDILNGGGGDDRIVGDRGTDTMNGGAGDDTLVWNNGDGTDVANGGDGRDDVEVNGAPAAGDAFAVQPNGARIRFDRTNLVPFSIDIGSSETLHANGLGGDDSVTVGDVGAFSVTAAGGAGNDTLTGADSPETLLGGSGNDTITAGGGLDVVSGDEGDDRVDIRDRTADAARGGDGNDSVLADNPSLDILDGFENVDRTPNDEPKPVGSPPPVIAPPPAHTATRPVTIRGGTVKPRGNIASITVRCPAASVGNCTGSFALRTAKSVRFGGLRAVLELGSARYDLAPGASKTLKVKLVSGIRRVADRNGRLKARAIASTGPSGKAAQSSRRLTLALGRSK